MRAVRAIVRLLLLLLFCSGWSSNVAADVGALSPVSIMPGMKIFPVAPYMKHWQPTPTDDDVTKALQLPDEQWQSIERTSINYVYSTTPHWFRLEIQNLEPSKQWYLEIPSPHFDHVAIYLFDSHHQLIKQFEVGDTLPFAARPVLHPNYYLPFHFEAQQNYTMLVRIKTSSRLFLIPALVPDDELLPHLLKSSLLYGGFFSVMLILSAYSLVIFFVTRVPAHLAYVAFQVSFVLYHAASSGYGFQYLWPTHPLMQQKMYAFSAAFAFACATVFIILFLQLREDYPRLYKFSTAFTVFWCVCSVGALLLKESLVMTMAFPFQLGALLFCLFGCCWLWWDGYKNAGYVTLGWGFQLFGTVLLILLENGIVEPSFITLYGMQIGSVIQMVSMSFALAELIREERETRRLVMLSNQTLEREVAAHTQALDVRNEELLAAQRQLVMQDKMAVLGIVSAGVAHEINNPTHFVRISAENIRVSVDEFKAYLNSLLTEEADDEIKKGFTERFGKIERQLGLVEEGTTRIAEIVASMRNYSRTDKADAQEFDVVDALLSTAQLVQMNYKQWVKIECDLRPGLIIRGRPTQLKQVFMNLLVNACQAIEERKEKGDLTGNGSVRVSAHNDETTLVLRIKDNGCGMTQDVMARLFERLFTTKSADKGTGLGLSISKEIVTQHGGQLEYESSPGQGTSAIITLPLISAGH